MYSEFKIKLPIYAYCTHIDTFKLDVYASQLYLNVTSKVARYTVEVYRYGNFEFYRYRFYFWQNLPITTTDPILTLH